VSLETGRITRNFHGTPDILDDDTFNISLNGLNGTLVLGSDGYYHTTNETFWRISFNGSNNTWTVNDKVGNEYTFSSKATYPTYSVQNNTCDFDGNQTWAWVLTSAKNQFRSDPNNAIVYDYTVWSKYAGVSGCGDGRFQNMQVSVYLNSIRYPNSRYRISFIRANRADYLPDWDTAPGLRVPFEGEYLSQIVVEHDAAGSGSFSVVRKYVFTYETNDSQKIFPGITWPEQTTIQPIKGAYNGMLTLKSVQEFGLNNAALPATVFTYGDNMHLTRVENGYGGKVEFLYDIWFLTPFGSSNSYKIDVGRMSLQPGSYTTPVNYTNPYTHPGAVYHVSGTFEPGLAGAKVGLSYWVGGSEIIWYGPEYSSGTTAEGYFLMPVNTATLDKGLVYCSNCQFKTLLFEMLPTKYRVVEKKVFDGLEGQIGDPPATFTYQYDGGAVNDAVHSTFIKDNPDYLDDYVLPYAEYRGNAAVTEVGPDGRATTTLYQQDDVFRGQAIYSYTTSQDYVQTFNVTKYPGSAPYGYTAGGTVNMILPDFCQNNSTNWTCAGSGTATQADLEGDEALSLINGKTVNRTSSPSYILEKRSAILQFRTVPGTTGNTRQLLLTVNSGGISLGISVRRDANNFPYVQSECTGCSGFSPTILVPAGTYKDNAWYLLFIVVDQGKVHLQVRARNDRLVYARLDFLIPTQPGRNWYFSVVNSAGFTSYLDNYQEGELHSLVLTTLAYQEPNGVTVVSPVRDGSGVYPTLGIYWTYPTAVATFTYSGADYQSAMTETIYDTSLQGGVQYGNVTDIYQSTWINNAWARYLQVHKQYYPNTTANLIGLPGYANTYKCPGGTCSPATANILTSTLYYYDSNTNYNQQPTAGVLKVKRTLTHFDNPADYSTLRYHDTSYQYDPWGNVMKTTQYTQEGTLSTVGGGTPVVTTVYYDPYYHTYPTAIMDALGYTTTIVYDYALGVPIRETGANGIHGRAWATYDNLGRMTALYRGDDGGAASVSVVYAGINDNPFWMQVTQKITDSQNSVTRKYYDGLGRIFQTQVSGATVNGEAGQTIRTDTYYDAYERAYRQSVPYVNTSLTGSEMDSAQKYALTTYDVWGRTTQIKGTDNTTTSTAYALFNLNNEIHQQVTTTDANGHTSVSLINTRGQVVKVQPQIGPAVTYSYDPLGQLTGSVYGNATPTSLTYDLAGQKTSMTDPDMGTWSYTYNGLGQLNTQTDARACTTTLNYDLLGRLTSKAYSGSDAACTRTSAPTYTYAAQNIPYQEEFNTTPPTSAWSVTGTASFSGGQAHVVGNNTWNSFFNRTPYTVVDTKGAKLTFKVSAGAVFYIYLENGVYGSPGYRRWGIYSNGQTLYRSYNEGTTNYSELALMPLKNDTWYQLTLEPGSEGTTGKYRIALLQQDGSNASVGVTETHTDGWMNQSFHLMVRQYSGTMDIENYQEIQYENKIQHRTVMTDASGSTTWDYDSRGRMTSETKTVTGAGTYTTAWTYNYADQVATMTYPTGETLNYSYLNQLLPNAMSGTNAYVTETRYDAAGRTTKRTLGNAIVTNYVYNLWQTDAGRLSQIQTGLGGSATIQNLTYDYDAVGNISSILDGIVTGGPQTQTFAYDAINRLTTASATGGNYGTYSPETYAYNASSGNLTTKAGLTLNYPAPGHAHAVSSTSGSNSWSFTYDANGNMITGNMTGPTLTYNYNAENQLVSVSSGQTYTYDGDGNLVVMTDSAGVKTVRIGSHYEVVNPGGSATYRRYYFLGGVRVAMRQTIGGSSSVTYFHTDHLGSVVATTDSGGGSTSTMLYKPWGETRYPTTPPTTPGYRYTGQLEVSGIGLYFYNARWYSPYLNRFLSPDDIIPDQYDPQSWDRYSYVKNNPVNYTDPTGHRECRTKDECSDSGTTPFGNINNPSSNNNTSSSTGKDVPVLPTFSNLPPSTSISPQCTIDYPCLYPWEPPEWWDLDPEHPDYYVLTINRGNVKGFTVDIIFDRYGNFYVGAGGNYGKSISPVTVSLNGGWIGSAVDDSIPEPGNISSFLTGLAINGQVGAVGNIAFTWSPFANEYIRHTSFEVGAMVPYAIGVSVTYSFKIFDGYSLHKRSK
jgi:RHS repeat-associated protein